jgi:hypothetical protein
MAREGRSEHLPRIRLTGTTRAARPQSYEKPNEIKIVNRKKPTISMA